MRVSLKRVAPIDNGSHAVIIGDTSMKPVVGRRFALFFEDNGTAKYLTTSEVQSINGDTFRTKNSTYEYTVLD